MSTQYNDTEVTRYCMFIGLPIQILKRKFPFCVSVFVSYLMKHDNAIGPIRMRSRLAVYIIACNVYKHICGCMLHKFILVTK